MAAYGIASIVKTLNGITFPFPQVTAGEAIAQIFAYSGVLDLDDPVHEKYVDYVILDVTVPEAAMLQGVTARVGWNDRVGQEIEWSELFDLATFANLPMFMRATARFWFLDIDDSIGSVSWKLSGVEFYGAKLEGQP